MPQAVWFPLLSTLLGLLACTDLPAGPVEQPPEPEQPVEEMPDVPASAALAFVSSRDGYEYIYVANADGSEVTRVTKGTSPAWSRDGRKIAFVRNANSPVPARIWVLDLDGRTLTDVGPGFDPAWSPDGRIVFSQASEWATSNGWRTTVVSLHVRNTNGAVALLYDRRGEAAFGGAAWSADGRRIAFRETHRTVSIVNADGSDLRALEELPEAVSTPAWSPDGSMIAVFTDPGPWQVCGEATGCRPGPGVGKSSVIYRYDLATADWQMIEAIRPEPAVLLSNPDWSPDGSQLVFDLLDLTVSRPCAGSCPPAGPPAPRRIFVMSMETGEMRQLIPDAAAFVTADYDDHGPVWSPANALTGSAIPRQ